MIRPLFTLITESSVSEDWNTRLLSGKTESLYLYHSTYWADRLSILLGYKPVYFSVYKNNALSLMLVGFIQPFFEKNKQKNIKKSLLVTLQSLRSVIHGVRGFVWYGQPIYFQEGNQDAYTFLAKSLDNFFQQKKVRLTYGEWPMYNGLALPRQWETKTWATLKIDLTCELDEIFLSLKSSARKEIQKAKKRGVIVERIRNTNQLIEYYCFAETCAKRYKKTLIGPADYLTMWEYFRGWGCFETFVAYYDSEIVGGLSIWGDSYGVMEIGSFQSEKSYSEKLGSSDAVKWEAICWAKSVGAKFFDLAGVNPHPANEKEKGIRSFKEKWSDHEVRYLVLQTRNGF